VSGEVSGAFIIYSMFARRFRFACRGESMKGGLAARLVS